MDTTQHRIVVGVTNSRSSRRALRWAYSIARKDRAILEVITARRSDSPELEIDAAARQDRILRDEVDIASPQAPPIYCDVVTGDPAEVLCSRGVGARLLVVGRSSPLHRLTRRSVTRACTQHASCSMAVVNAEAGIDEVRRR